MTGTTKAIGDLSSYQRYAEARARWLREHDELWFPLAQLLVSTIDIEAKKGPRSIRGLNLNENERRYLADFHAFMRAELGRTS